MSWREHKNRWTRGLGSFRLDSPKRAPRGRRKEVRWKKTHK